MKKEYFEVEDCVLDDLNLSAEEWKRIVKLKRFLGFTGAWVFLKITSGLSLSFILIIVGSFVASSILKFIG